MNPIINPLWFYLIDTVTSLKVVFLVIGVSIWTVLTIVSILYLSWDVDDFKERLVSAVMNGIKIELKLK